MPAPASETRRVDDSMSLLVDMMRNAEDPGYAEAAAARPAGPARRAPRSVVLLAAVGALIGIAGAAVRAAADQGSPGRAGLVSEVTRRTAESDLLSREAAALRADVAARREAALAQNSRGRTEAARLAGLELAAATVAVTGDGLVATLDDRPAEPAGSPGLVRGGQVGAGRVLDRDLQDLVNGLWAAGAEAVSVNDLRLTARTAIRSAGQAILVDFRPLVPPYVVQAIGAPGRLLPAFLDGATGRRLETYTSLYGLRFDAHAATGLRLAAGRVPDPRSAMAVTS